MDIKSYRNPYEEGMGDKVAESVAVYPSQIHQLDALRHQVMDAVASSDDKTTLVICLNMLTKQKKHSRKMHQGLTDEELAAKLAASAETDWENEEHADLSQIDYSKYKPYHSAKIQKSLEKWL